MERDGRIGLPTSVWKTEVIPFYESRIIYLVETTGIEPVVPWAADLQSTASPLMLRLHILWCPREDSNSRHPDYKSGALPTELQGLRMVGVAGIKPATSRSQT